jgi:hypothetical protein
MARRRQEIALQAELETQEEWNDAINKEGLTGDFQHSNPLSSFNVRFVFHR